MSCRLVKSEDSVPSSRYFIIYGRARYILWSIGPILDIGAPVIYTSDMVNTML